MNKFSLIFLIKLMIRQNVYFITSNPIKIVSFGNMFSKVDSLFVLKKDVFNSLINVLELRLYKKCDACRY
jgi:hypothetical protein